MTHRKLLQTILGTILVIWLSVGCGASKATTIPPTATPTPESPLSTQPIVPTTTPTSTIILGVVKGRLLFDNEPAKGFVALCSGGKIAYMADNPCLNEGFSNIAPLDSVGKFILNEVPVGEYTMLTGPTSFSKWADACFVKIKVEEGKNTDLGDINISSEGTD